MLDKLSYYVKNMVISDKKYIILRFKCDVVSTFTEYIVDISDIDGNLDTFRATNLNTLYNRLLSYGFDLEV